MDWRVVDCHQFLSLENNDQRLVFNPIQERIVEVVLNDIYGTRILIPENSSFTPTPGTHDDYKHQACNYIRQNLRIISAGGSINKAGKFCRLNFVIEDSEYRISDIQYVS